MTKERDKLLRKLCAVCFSITDMELYLDSHIESEQINKKLTEYKQKAAFLKAEYEEKYGPLVSSNSGINRYSWISNPWPWDNTEECD